MGIVRCKNPDKFWVIHEFSLKYGKVDYALLSFSTVARLLKLNKLHNPSITLEFPNISLDTVALEAHLSAENFSKLQESLKLLLGTGKCKKKVLL